MKFFAVTRNSYLKFEQWTICWFVEVRSSSTFTRKGVSEKLFQNLLLTEVGPPKNNCIAFVGHFDNLIRLCAY